MFSRILSLDGSCVGGHQCPNILEMNSGEIAVIGSDVTPDALASLPAGAGCGPHERVVKIPRAVLNRAIATLQNPL